MDKVRYSIYGDCCKLSNGTVDVLVTAELGPRVIFYGFTGGENMFAELDPDLVVKHDWGEWHARGGHRLWHTLEELPRSYVPDNDPIEMEVESLGPLTMLEPGDSTAHVERWYLFDNVEPGDDTEESLDAAITPLVRQTESGA